jgi:hypothetical protein
VAQTRAGANCDYGAPNRFRLHFVFNSAPLFNKFTSDIGDLLPVFWVGFNVGDPPFKHAQSARRLSAVAR